MPNRSGIETADADREAAILEDVADQLRKCAGKLAVIGDDRDAETLRIIAARLDGRRRKAEKQPVEKDLRAALDALAPPSEGTAENG